MRALFHIVRLYLDSAFYTQYILYEVISKLFFVAIPYHFERMRGRTTKAYLVKVRRGELTKQTPKW